MLLSCLCAFVTLNKRLLTYLLIFWLTNALSTSFHKHTPKMAILPWASSTSWSFTFSVTTLHTSDPHCHFHHSHHRSLLFCFTLDLKLISSPRSRGATTFSKLGVQFLGLGYYYPVWCSRLHNNTLFIKKQCKKLREVSPNFGEVRTPEPPVVALMPRSHFHHRPLLS